MSFSHDPYRAASYRVPQIDPDAEPASGSLTVVAVVDRYPPWVNAGAEWMLHHLLRPLVEAGHQVFVVTGAVDEPAEFEGVFVLPETWAATLAAEADVLVGHLLWTREAVALAAEHRKPLVYLMHNDNQIAHWRLTPPQVSLMVWNSEWVKASCRQRHPVWVDRPSVVVRPPCLPRDYDVEGDPFGREFVTLVNPTPEKGAETFYEITARRASDRYLIVEGGYGRQVDPPPARGIVKIRPTRDMRGDVYARTRVLCVPSVYESWGRVAVEAMCAGIPVIAHPTPGLRESLGPGGLFADRDRPGDWVEILDRLDDPDFYRQRSAEARARARTLAKQAGLDLAGWEYGIRLAATARRLPSASMIAHDPFRAHSDRPGPVTVEADPAWKALHVPETGSGDGDGPEPTDSQETAVQTVSVDADPLPSRASAVVAWITAVEGDERTRRALRAQIAEEGRDKQRQTVLDAIAAVLG